MIFIQFTSCAGIVVSEFPHRVQSFNRQRNEWLAFTYQDGEYLITTDVGVDFKKG